MPDEPYSDLPASASARGAADDPCVASRTCERRLAAARRRLPRFVVASFGVGVAALTCRTARAETPVCVQYEVGAGCPDEAAFFAALDRDRATLRRASPSERATSLTVTTTTSDDGEHVRGRVEAEDERGMKLVREVSTATCSQAVEALAFAIAIAFNPAAGAPPPAAPEPSRDAPVATPKEPAAPRRLSAWRAGADADGSGGIAPRLSFGASAFVEFLPRGEQGGPSLRLTAEGSSSGQVDAAVGAARFRLLDAALDACPIAVEPAARVRLAPCAGLALGSLRASGSGVDVARAADEVWVAARLLGRAQWGWGAGWFGELGAGIDAPLRRKSYVFDPPRTTIYTVAPLGGELSAGVGVRFL